MRRKKMIMGVLSFGLLAAIGGAVFVRSLGMFASAPVYQTREGAIDGYDAVAYFTRGEPVRGSTEFVHQWQDAQWHFASDEHRALFAADPERYAPQFGGYCAYAVSENYTARTDPEAWAIVDGKLYLNFDRAVALEWEASRSRRIAQAEGLWPAVLVGR